jgi:hypothetical protein
MEGSKMKPWMKVGLSVLTVGVTVTAIYFGVKAIRKRMAKNADQKTTDKKVEQAADKVVKK